ncbi:hypothetical protein Q7P35_003216 [Cladosporium inversicolor]
MNDHLHHETVWLLITNGATQTEDRAVSPQDRRGTLNKVHDGVYELRPRAESISLERMLQGLRSFRWTRRMLHNAIGFRNAVSVGTELMRSMKAMLEELFGGDEANAMQQYISRNGRESTWPAHFLMPGAWRSKAGEATQFMWEDPPIPLTMEPQITSPSELPPRSGDDPQMIHH